MPVVKSNKVENGALFTDMTRQPNFTNLMVDTADMSIKKKGDSVRGQSGKGAPIVRVTNLSKEAGDEVEMDVFHILNKTPTMGDKPLDGRGETLTSSSMDLKILQGRHMVNPGGKMAQQRTKHELKAIARNELAGKGGYYSRLCDETTLYHLAGARGTREATHLIVPGQAHPEFGEILVNGLQAPTYDRHFYGGDATSLNDIDSSDVFTLDTVENMRLLIDEQDSMVMQPIRFKGDMLADEDPMYVLYLTPRQFKDFKATTSAKQWQEMYAAAKNRTASISKNPIFAGDCYFWEGILIKKMNSNWVEFAAGTPVNVCQNVNEATETTVAPGVNVHRGVLLGAQALGWAFGNVGSQGGDDMGYVGLTEEEKDHGNAYEISCRWMDGKKKIRFADKNGRKNDHGVMVVDTAVSQ